MDSLHGSLITFSLFSLSLSLSGNLFSLSLGIFSLSLSSFYISSTHSLKLVSGRKERRETMKKVRREIEERVVSPCCLSSSPISNFSLLKSLSLSLSLFDTISSSLCLIHSFPNSESIKVHKGQ